MTAACVGFRPTAAGRLTTITVGAGSSALTAADVASLSSEPSVPSGRTHNAIAFGALAGEMSMPLQRGDLMIRDRNNRFVVNEVGTRTPLSIVCESLTEAIRYALETKPGKTIWRENADHRGRPLGPPIQIHPSPRR